MHHRSPGHPLAVQANALEQARRGQVVDIAVSLDAPHGGQRGERVAQQGLNGFPHQATPLKGGRQHVSDAQGMGTAGRIGQRPEFNLADHGPW